MHGILQDCYVLVSCSMQIASHLHLQFQYTWPVMKNENVHLHTRPGKPLRLVKVWPELQLHYIQGLMNAF